MSSRTSLALPVERNGRRVAPELLDTLPTTDPRARRSRRDLCRINAWMGNAGILSRLLRTIGAGEPGPNLAELGGGDGRLMLEVARRLGESWRGTTFELVDRQNLVSAETREQFAQVEWRVRVWEGDVFDWLTVAAPGPVIAANLFLHHFENGRLRELLGRASGLARAFVACEPRRMMFPRVVGPLLGLLGCNGVTRHDAIASVRAGFRGSELSALWPAAESWRMSEGPAGLFSHGFVARRVS